MAPIKGDGVYTGLLSGVVRSQNAKDTMDLRYRESPFRGSGKGGGVIEDRVSLRVEREGVRGV